jgi:hypothetical protein
MRPVERLVRPRGAKPLPLLRFRPTYIRQPSAVGRPKLLIVTASLRQTERTIGAAPHFVNVVAILTIVFPEADRTNLVAASTQESKTRTAGTPIARPAFRGLSDVLKRVAHVV